ncbi:glycoside hydrolase family 35 protein [Dyella silvatica]|uniref:glycoside hydrolase family 35 protein n=1 Tax=Dyella silvatica TaxID=2992128 RepID=UPI0022541EBE|nr:glycoside hydrolase family 35 protein [Dyella silvatica]
MGRPKSATAASALKWLGVSMCMAFAAAGAGRAATKQPGSPPASHALSVQHGKFMLDGKPFQIISGEMHYPRIPREYWRSRLKMAKAMGLNTITSYVFWNAHESTPGVYDFQGQNDLAEFIREAQQEGLYVILRPGPYVCAEWEFGGFPSWLLKDQDIKVRSTDPKFMRPVQRWLHRLGSEVAGLQLARGGNIIAVQVENEYGSFGDDQVYLDGIRRTLVDSGFDKSLLYTSDSADRPGALPDLPVVINFGTGHAKEKFAQLHRWRPDGPSMTGEYWAGWFDHWGAPHHTADASVEAKELAWMLGQGYSVSMYMFHGGTSFGWMNGANWDEDSYQPDVTSYDYDAPLGESGRPSPKYFALRKAIAEATQKAPPPLPEIPSTQAIAGITLNESASLWDNLPTPTMSHELKTMEDLDQAYGDILYRKKVVAETAGELVIDGLHDYAQIYVDGALVGTLDRRLKQNKLAVKLAKGSTLDILVENSGRINFGKELLKERKGILGSVSVKGSALSDWQIYSLPLSNYASLNYSSKPCRQAPCFYRGSFDAAMSGSASADTFLDTTGLTKGFAWLNGHPLGRIWKIGPQRTLYVPGVWLKPKGNQLTVIDLQGAGRPVLNMLKQPILDAKATAALP